MREATVTVLGDGTLASAIARYLAQDLRQLTGLYRLSVRHDAPGEGIERSPIPSSDPAAPAPVLVVAVPSAAAGSAPERQSAALLVGAGVGRVLKHSRDAVIVMATAPVGAMCEAARRVGAPPAQVLGVAGGVASAGLRAAIAQELQVAVEDVAALVLGGGGGELVPLPRYAAVAGIPAAKLLPKRRLAELVRGALEEERRVAAWEEGEGEPADLVRATGELVGAVVADSQRILPCAAYLTGEFGLEGVWLGVPCRVGAGGVRAVLEVPLAPREREQLGRAAAAVRQRMATLPSALGSA